MDQERQSGLKDPGMKKRYLYILCLLCAFIVLSGCSDQNNTTAEEQAGIKEETEEGTVAGLKREEWQIDRHGTVYVYMPDDIADSEKVSLILDMNCTTGNPEAEVKTNGWDKAAVRYRFIVVAPTYNDYATYSEAAYMIQVVDAAESRYNIDAERVYATGFSNGGALSVALASEYPERFAAISAAGWMVGARNTDHGYLMPFQVLQGTEEYTETDSSGNREIMEDEKEAIRDLFDMNGMDRGKTDYHETPYWGYRADKTTVLYPEYTDYDPYGNNPVKRKNVQWTVSDYYRDGYQSPFAQLILIDGAAHIPHSYHAEAAWAFFSHFKRNQNGVIEEIE